MRKHYATYRNKLHYTDKLVRKLTVIHISAYKTPLKVHSNHLIKLIRWTEHAKKHGVTFKVKSVDRCVEVI